MFDVRLQLLCTARSGTLSRLIREINQIGLQYTSHEITANDDESTITINASGDPNCTRKTLQDLFTDFPEVLQLQQLDIHRDGKPVNEFRTRVTQKKIPASEQLTPAVRLAAEKRLSDMLGPAASVIVEGVIDDCRNAGDLYLRLADELNDPEERRYFLSVLEQ